MGDAFKPHSHVPYGPEGSGFYSDHVVGVYQVMDKVSEIITAAIDEVKFDAEAGRAFTVADYGTADGGTSMPLLTKTIGQLKKKYGEGQEVNIWYEDQATNDFKALFSRLYGLKPGSTSYLQQYRGVFPSACGTGFYDQCFASGTVNLGICATAMHWLLKRPCILKNCLDHASSADEMERKAFTKAASDDYERFLLHRAKELAPGGHMVATIPQLENYPGQYTTQDGRIEHPLLAAMSKHWHDMLDERIITKDEFEETTFNFYFRTEAESRKPFDDVTSEVYKAGLRLVSIETHLVLCPFNQAWKKVKQIHLKVMQRS